MKKSRLSLRFLNPRQKLAVSETDRKVGRACLNRAVLSCARIRVAMMKRVKILVDKINSKP